MAKILVVEDEALNIEILSRFLSPAGHEVSIAQSRNAAISAVQGGAVDLVLMDIHIPNSDGEAVNVRGGLEAARWIKSNPETSSVPIIAMSVGAMLDERTQQLEAGCDDVHPKPIKRAALLDCIERHLRHPK